MERELLPVQPIDPAVQHQHVENVDFRFPIDPVQYPTGILKEAAVQIVIDRLNGPGMRDVAKYRQFLLEGMRLCVRRGLTSVHSNDDYALGAYRALQADHQLPLRVFLTPLHEELLCPILSPFNISAGEPVHVENAAADEMYRTCTTTSPVKPRQASPPISTAAELKPFRPSEFSPRSWLHRVGKLPPPHGPHIFPCEERCAYVGKGGISDKSSAHNLTGRERHFDVQNADASSSLSRLAMDRGGL